MELRLIREALAEQIAGQLARPTNVYAQDPGPTRQPPCVVIEPGEPYVDYHTTYGNALCEIHLDVTVHVVSSDEVSAQVALDDYLSDLSPSSVRAAIESGRPAASYLGGLADEVVCYRSHRPTPAGDTNALTATFEVTVYARREQS